MTGKKTIVFDLDDTLVKEIDYLKSAFREIAQFLHPEKESLFEEMFAWYSQKENVFAKLQELYKTVQLNELKQLYRNHVPDFSHVTGVVNMLQKLKKEGHFLGLITDGFSVTQRNKIKALGIEELFDRIVISEEFGSEKPAENNFSVFHQFGTKDYFYISDNVAKDFITPNKLGWISVCLLDNGQNIHPQDFNRDSIYLPSVKIHSLDELDTIINTS